jgi:glutaredoxin
MRKKKRGMDLMTSTVKQIEVKVYSTATCPNCTVLKAMLKTEAIEFSEVNMASPAGLTDLRMAGVFTMSAPVLQIGLNISYMNELLTKHCLISSMGRVG